MKRIITLVTLILLTTLSLPAQSPPVMYIIPDIGAPGMNVYIEILAPTNVTAMYGPDGLPTNVKVRALRVADTSKITFSQPVVSWDGRLISVQAFINPTLTPNSWDWSALTPEYVVPVIVDINGSNSNAFNFYIVQPQHLGDVSSLTEKVLGQGALGRRSQRGAMIVDSLILGNAGGTRYTVSTTIDPDVNSAGNQAYLPFILLSRGPVKSVASNVILSVEAGLGSKNNNGGVGGGGGGGAFRDRATGTSRGNDGGDGYVAGGAGGVNNILSSSGDWEMPGVGTGSDGSSLNGVQTAQNSTRWESAGGGTGHPFGSSGLAVNSGNDDDLPGGYGGGTGYKQNTRGGSGGYFTAGTNSGSQNGGKPHGNKMIVPLAGGSGGASGNPQYSNIFGSEIAGNGGGGGGAMRILATQIENLAFSANGGAGQYGYNNAEGGNGSGGAIELGAKINIPGPTNFSAQGGSNGAHKGGVGYLRWDSPLPVNIGPPAAGESVYRGFTTDTSMWVGRKHKITGSNAPGESLTFFLYAPSTGWKQVGGVETRSPWDLTIDLPKPDTIFYFYAMRSVTNPSTTPRLMEPSYLLAQSAGNVFRIVRNPVIDAPDYLLRHFFLCEGTNASDTITFWVKNYGEEDLTVDFSNVSWNPPSPQFELVSPKTLTNIKENDSVQVKIAVSKLNRANMSPSTTLLLNHNAKNEASPFPVQIQMLLATADLESFEGTRNIGTTETNGLYLGEICAGEKISKKITVRYDSTGPGRHEKITVVPPTLEQNSALNITMPPPDVVLDMKQTFEMTVELDTKALPTGFMGRHAEKVLLYTRDCPDPVDTILVYADVMAVKLSLYTTESFPDTKVGNTSTIFVTLGNIGNRPATITASGLSGLFAPFRVVSTNPALPTDLAPGGAIGINLEFAPTSRGEFYDTLVATAFVTCPDETTLAVRGRGTAPGLYLSKFRWDIDTTQLCVDAPLDSFYLGNSAEATAPFRLKTPASLRGTGAGAWAIVEQPAADADLAPGDSVKYKLKFSPTAQGVYDAELVINTQNAGQDEIVYKLHGAAGDMDLQFSPDPIQYTDIEAGFPYKSQLTVTNVGWKAANIASITSVNPDWSVSPSSGVIPPYGGQMVVDIMTTPTETSSRSTVINFEIAPGSSCVKEYKRGALFTTVLAEIDTTKSVNFGSLSPCDSANALAYIVNVGTTRIVVLSHELVGGDNLFSDETPAHTYPDTLSINERIDYNIKFKPRNSTDGPKNAILRLRALINGVEKTIDIELTGGMQSGLATFPNSIEFGTVTIGSQNEKILKIKNNGPWKISLGTIIPPSLAEFVITPADFAGKVLNVGDSVEVKISFNSQTAGEYKDTVRFNLSIGGCDQLISVGIHANNVPGKELILRMPELTADPRDDEFEIPVYAKFKTPTDSLANFTIDTLEISFNRTLFFLRSADAPAQLISMSYDGLGNISILLTVPSLNLSSKDSIVTILRGNAMLGNEKSTPLIFNKIAWSEPLRVTSIDTASGLLHIEICEKGGDRLIDRAGSSSQITVAPNPSSDGKVTIRVAALERGDYKIDLLSVDGDISELKQFAAKAPGESFTFTENLSGFASGVYAVRLSTPSEVKYTTILIVK